jgi:hypothetical protein
MLDNTRSRRPPQHSPQQGGSFWVRAGSQEPPRPHDSKLKTESGRASDVRLNRIRSEQARRKAALCADEARAAPLLFDPPQCLQTVSVAEVLLAVRDRRGNAASATQEFEHRGQPQARAPLRALAQGAGGGTRGARG